MSEPVYEWRGHSGIANLFRNGETVGTISLLWIRTPEEDPYDWCAADIDGMVQRKGTADTGPAARIACEAAARELWGDR